MFSLMLKIGESISNNNARECILYPVIHNDIMEVKTQVIEQLEIALNKFKNIHSLNELPSFMAKTNGTENVDFSKLI